MTKAEIMEHETRDLLHICQDVHMTTTGSLERSDSEQERDLYILRLRLKHWEVSFPKYSPYDGAVKNLVERTILESFVHLHK